jgi:hypothetical protein
MMISPSKIISLLLVSPILVRYAAGACQKNDTLEVTQEAVVSTFSPITTNQSVQEFYSYTTSYNGPVPLMVDTSLIFIHRDNTTCELSLVIVHDTPGVFPSPITGGMVIMEISGNLANAVVKNDPTGDTYWYDQIGDVTRITWLWGGVSNDGLAHVVDNLSSECIKVFFRFKWGIKSWKWVEPDDLGGYTYHGLNLTEPIEICAAEREPEPDYCDVNICHPMNIFCVIIFYIRCLILARWFGN